MFFFFFLFLFLLLLPLYIHNWILMIYILADLNELQVVMPLPVRYVSSSFLVIWYPGIQVSFSCFICVCLVRSIGLWKYCDVWKIYFLVLGDFSCSILLCYLGVVSCPTEFDFVISHSGIYHLLFLFLGERSGGVGWFDMLAYKFVHSMTLHRIFHMQK